jgi:hypothetical protein
MPVFMRMIVPVRECVLMTVHIFISIVSITVTLVPVMP